MQLPVVRIELENMRHQVMCHLVRHHEEIQEHVDAQLKDAINGFDFKETVNAAANTAIRAAVQDAVKAFFSYGKGRAVIEAAVKDSLADMYGEKAEEK